MLITMMTKGNDIMTLIENVEYALKTYKELNHNPPNEPYINGDTILADIVENADMEVPGLCENLLNIYLKSNDKKSLEDMFECITRVPFECYIDDCIQNTGYRKS